MLCMPTLHLKVSTQVILIQHVDPSLASGTIRRVMSFSNCYPHRLPGSSEATLVRYPVVRFPATPSGYQLKLVEPFQFTVHLTNGELATRTQVNHTLIHSCVSSHIRPGTPPSRMGHIHPKVTWDDIRSSQGGCSKLSRYVPTPSVAINHSATQPLRIRIFCHFSCHRYPSPSSYRLQPHESK